MALILLADDDAATRDLIRRTLEADGHQVTVTTDGAEALETFEKDPASFALVITDADMPELDGIALSKKIAAKRPDAGILLMSALDSELERGRSLGLSRIAVLSKPFTLEAMRAAVQKLLSRG